MNIFTKNEPKDYEAKVCKRCLCIYAKEAEKCVYCNHTDFRIRKVTKSDYEILERILKNNPP